MYLNNIVIGGLEVEWSWQILLFVLASFGVGMLLGTLLNHLIRRFAKKLGTFLDHLIKRFAKKHRPTLVVEEQLKYTPPDLVEEIESNRKIATEPWTGKLLSFQTHMWDTSQDEVYRLPRNLREDLTQAYVDMRLANSIVWLSTELGRRSHNLDENYMKLCDNIAVRLDRITPLLKWSGD